MEEPLFEYINKIKILGEYLARGNELFTIANTVISIDANTALYEDIISLEETELWDPLECQYYGELGSIKRMIECINEFNWEKLKKEIMPTISKQTTLSEEYQKVYNTTKSRIKNILNKIVLQLYCGLRVIPIKEQISFIQEFSSAENTDEIEDEQYEDEYEENKETPYLIYSATQKKFYLMQEGEVLVENVKEDLAMEITIDYLYSEERRKALEELQNGKTQKSNLEYDGMHIYKDKDIGEK